MIRVRRRGDRCSISALTRLRTRIRMLLRLVNCRWWRRGWRGRRFSSQGSLFRGQCCPLAPISSFPSFPFWSWGALLPPCPLLVFLLLPFWAWGHNCPNPFLSWSHLPQPLLVLRRGFDPNPRPFPYPGEGMQPLPSAIISRHGIVETSFTLLIWLDEIIIYSSLLH